MRTNAVKLMVLVMVVTILCGFAQAAPDEEQKISMDKLPKAVKAVVIKASQGGKVAEIELTGKGEEAIYEVDIVQGGKELELQIAANGKVLSKKLEGADDESKAPKKVVAKETDQALKKDAPKKDADKAPKKIAVKKDADKAPKKDAVKKDVEKAPKKIAAKKDVDKAPRKDAPKEDVLKSLPKAVQAAIHKAAKGGKVGSIKVVYEIEMIVNGKEVELEIAPCGTVLSCEVDDEDGDDEDDEDGDDEDDEDGDDEDDEDGDDDEDDDEEDDEDDK